MSENSEVTKYDPSRLMDAVRDRIRSEFIGLIPQEQWSAMVRREIDEYFLLRSTGYQQTNTTAFREDVRRILRERLANELKNYFAGPDWCEDWNDNGKLKTSVEVRRLIIESLPEILQAVLSQAIQATIGDMRQRMQ